MLGISAFTCTSALGEGLTAHREALLSGRSGLRWNDDKDCDLDTWVGRVDGLEGAALPVNLETWDCRNNRLAWLALQQDGFIQQVENAVSRYGANRVAVFMGTSTSGIRNTELEYAAAAPEFAALSPNFNYDRSHNCASLARFVATALGLEGIHSVISTACSSSAKVFASAERAIRAGLCDAAVVGGVDTLCLTTLYGFNALQLVSTQACRPADSERDGISIGEAGGFALVTKSDEAAYRLLGYGESSDAYHMSSPEPNGLGAATAMQAALGQAGISSVDYINLHGTATPANDRAESRGVKAVFSDQIACSSTKGYTGHTLGAAGILEACFSLLAIEQQCIWPSLNTVNIDPEVDIDIALTLRRQPVSYVLTNSFGFGGSNCSLVFGKKETK